MKEKIFFTARGIVSALLFYILTTFLVGIIAGSFCQGILGDGEITKLTAKVVTYGIILVILLSYYKKEIRFSWEEFGEKRNIVRCMCIVVAFVIAITAWEFIVSQILELFDWNSINPMQIEIEKEVKASLPLCFIYCVILVPICEEIICRGCIFGRARKHFNFWISAAVSAIIFAFLHESAIQIMDAFVVGIILAYLYERYDNLLVPVALHLLLNTRLMF